MNVSGINQSVNFGRVTPVTVIENGRTCFGDENLQKSAQIFYSSIMPEAADSFIRTSRLNEPNAKGEYTKPKFEIIDETPCLVTGKDTYELRKNPKNLKPDDEDTAHLRIYTDYINERCNVRQVAYYVNDSDETGNNIETHESLRLSN